ncbi:MAG: hypothetical protein GY835_07940 [bacterium]|nr:hypothetical protein [bacterium]
MSKTYTLEEIDRREFLAIVLGTVSAATLALGDGAPWPAEEFARPQAEPMTLALQDGYIVDPSFDYGSIELPTHREYLTDQYSEERMRKDVRDCIVEHGCDEAYEWTEKEVQSWLDEIIDVECLGDYECQERCGSEWAEGIWLHNRLDAEMCHHLGLHLVEGDCPGSSFMGVRFTGDLKDLNRELVRQGMNLILEV